MPIAPPPPLPDDVEALKQLVLDERAKLVAATIEIDQLKLLIAKLRRLQFGRSSEKLSREIEQLELRLEELQTAQAQATTTQEPSAQPQREKPARKPLPEHLPREQVVHQPACACPDCGGALRRIGEDVAEVLEYVPDHFKVVRQVRPKLSCANCQRIVQAAAPSRPIARGMAGPALLAHSTPIICRCTGRRRSTRGRELISIARRLPTGLAIAVGCSHRWSMCSAAT